MKSLLFFLYGLLFIAPGSSTVEKWIIEKNSTLTIDGKTNINTFRCDIVEYRNGDTVFLVRDAQAGKPIAVKGALNINVNEFDCHHKFITADLKNTLKADVNPYMRIQLLTLGTLKPGAAVQTTKGQAEIRLAGITRRIEIDYTVHQKPGFLHLTGVKKVLFSDFKLHPPRKLAGMIKVEQEITVQFRLALRSAGK